MIKQFITFLGLMTAPHLYAIDIFALDIPGLHVADGKGQYDRIIQQVPNTKIMVDSVKRAFHRFETCRDCCISPANKNPEFYSFSGDNYIVSKPMNLAKVYIFSQPGKPVVTELSALQGKNVGARLGMPYGKKVEQSGLKPNLVATDAQNINLLKGNRIDYMIAYTPDAYDAFQSLGIEPFPHDKDKPINVHEDAVVCKATPEAKAFIEKLNVQIK